MFPEEHVVDTYLRHYAWKHDQDFWAFDEVNQRVLRDPVAGWRVTFLLISATVAARGL